MSFLRFVLFLGCLFPLFSLGSPSQRASSGEVEAVPFLFSSSNNQVSPTINVRKGTGYGLYVVTAKISKNGVLSFFPEVFSLRKGFSAGLHQDWIALALKNLPEDTTFNPYTQYHTYSLEWLPHKVALYVDAAQDGSDVKNAVPAIVLGQNNETLLSRGAWKQKRGQQLLDTEQIFKPGQGQFSFTLQMHQRENLKDPAYGYISKVAIYPPDEQGGYVTEISDPRVFSVDFTTWKTGNWWPLFRKYFMAEHKTDQNSSLHHVDFGKFFDDSNKALRLDTMKKKSKQAIYKISPKEHTRAVFYLTESESLIVGQATSPLVDFFPVTHDMDITVSNTNIDEYTQKRCQLQLTAEGKVIVKKGAEQKRHCDFLKVMQTPENSKQVNLVVDKVLPKKVVIEQLIVDETQIDKGAIAYAIEAMPGLHVDLFGNVLVTVSSNSLPHKFFAKPGETIMLMVTAEDTGIVNVCHITLIPGGYFLAEEGGDYCQFLKPARDRNIVIGPRLIVPR